MKKILLLFCMLPTLCAAETIEFTKTDAINLMVSSYVHGFKEFDTSVVGLENSVNVGIYYDTATQEKQRAEMLGTRFRKQIPTLLSKYKWGKRCAASLIMTHFLRKIG